MAQARLQSSPFSAKNSPRGRRNDDSPSRQGQWELERALSQLQLHEIESFKLHAYQKRQQQEDLDAREAAQAQAHRLELNAANAQHEIVRKQAEAVLQAYIKREAEERRRREEEERRKLEEEERRRVSEEEARRRADEDRRAREEKERHEREERVRQEAEQRAKHKAEAEAKARKDREDTERQQQEDQARADQRTALKKQQEAAAAAAAAAKATPAAQPTASQSTTTQTRTPTTAIETRHNEYLALHRKLKTFRKEFWASTRQNPALKPHVGDMRRAIKTVVGQLTDDKEVNRQTRMRVERTLLRALKELPSPPVAVSDFLPAHLNLGDNGATTIPSLLLYLLNIFSKAVMAAFVGECAINPKAAEPIGTLVAQMFSLPALQFTRHPSSAANFSQTAESQSLIPILMCKYHAVAPILFGISGSESTTAGKLCLGWRRDNVGDADEGRRAFTTQQKQYERLTGLGVGYASIALRNFSRSATLQNPLPPVYFWASLAHIANTPPQEVQTSHLILLKNILENNAIERFVLFFGAVGVAALRQAVVEFPRTLPREMQEKMEVKSLGAMVEKWKKEYHFSLS